MVIARHLSCNCCVAEGIKMSSKPVEKYLLRVDAELMQWIREQAEANHRTISGQYRLMLEMARDEIESEHA